MYNRNYNRLRKTLYLSLLLLSTGILVSCNEKQTADISYSNTNNSSQVVEVADNSSGNNSQASASENNADSAQTATPPADDACLPQESDFREQFGENCITNQTFEINFSEYAEKVFFVPFAPSSDNPKFHMQIISDGEVLTDIPAYVPDNLAEDEFVSLDAVSFYDVNYDGNTDIVLIQTYGNTCFAAVYYGFPTDTDYFKGGFLLQEQLSVNLSNKVNPLTIPEIRNFLANGKKNGTFVSYQEAYIAVSKLCELEDTSNTCYDLIYFDEDSLPELATGVNGCYVSLYTYHDGTVYTLMDHWAYGAMGNAGYEYCPSKNSLRNYNSDLAGAILYTTYMTISPLHSMDTVVQIKTVNFDDVNGNEFIDENEQESVGRYSMSYIDDREITAEECFSYNVGEYKYIETTLNLDELCAKLHTD